MENANNDERLYLKSSILEVPILGLLDSGALRTFLGVKGRSLLPLTSTGAIVSVANGERCESMGSLLVPISVQKK